MRPLFTTLQTCEYSPRRCIPHALASAVYRLLHLIPPPEEQLIGGKPLVSRVRIRCRAARRAGDFTQTAHRPKYRYREATASPKNIEDSVFVFISRTDLLFQDTDQPQEPFEISAGELNKFSRSNTNSIVVGDK